MKTTIFTLLLLLVISINSIAQYPSFDWGYSFSNNEFEGANSIIHDSLGNVYMTGSFEGEIDFDPGSNTYNLSSNGDKDIYVQKINFNGELEWAFSIGGTGMDIGYSIDVDNQSNIYITGLFTGEVDFDSGTGISNLIDNGTYGGFIVKCNSQGQLVWARNIGGSFAAQGNTIKVDSYYNVIVTGSFAGSVDFDPGVDTYILNLSGSPHFILKLNELGEFEWVSAVAGDNSTRIKSPALDDNDIIYITGSSNDTINCYFGSDTLVMSSVAACTFILKFNPNGSLIWNTQIYGLAGTNHGPAGTTLSLDMYNNIYIAGAFSGPVDFDPGIDTSYLEPIGNVALFLLKLNSYGEYCWSRKFDGNCFDRVQASACDRGNNIYIAGYYTSTIDFDPGPGSEIYNVIDQEEIFILKINSAGNFEHVSVCGGYSNFTPSNILKQCPNSITVDNKFNIYTCGFFCGDLEFNPGSGVYNTTSGWEHDIIVIKLNQCKVVNSIYVETCDTYEFNGDTLDRTGIYYDSLTTISNCDSIIILHLTISEIDTSVNLISNTLTANATPATYQWIYCDNNFTEIPGEIYQSFTPTVNGYYAVIITENGCTDTSACYTILGIGISEYEDDIGLKIYPNPVKDNLIIEGLLEGDVVRLYGILGNRIYFTKTSETSSRISLNSYSTGVYFLKVRRDDQVRVFKIIKQ